MRACPHRRLELNCALGLRDCTRWWLICSCSCVASHIGVLDYNLGATYIRSKILPFSRCSYPAGKKWTFEKIMSAWALRMRRYVFCLFLMGGLWVCFVLILSSLLGAPMAPALSASVQETGIHALSSQMVSGGYAFDAAFSVSCVKWGWNSVSEVEKSYRIMQG